LQSDAIRDHQQEAIRDQNSLSTACRGIIHAFPDATKLALAGGSLTSKLVRTLSHPAFGAVNLLDARSEFLIRAFEV
jgi:hypothetical protein